jgi:hypothetical protein
MALFLFKPFGLRGDCFYAATGWFASRYRAQKAERHQTALRGQAPTRSHVRTASSVPLSRGRLDVAPQKPLRADEPVTQIDELGPEGNGWQPGQRRGNRDPRALLWPGCLPRRLQLVFTRSSGRHSLFVVAAIQVGVPWCSNRDGLLWVRCKSSVTGPGANPIVTGSDRCRSETGEVEASEDSLETRSS